MSFRKLNTFLLIAAGILTLASCKDDDTEVTPSLSGSLSFEVDAFVAPGQLVKMTPKGAVHPEGKGIGYYWKVTPGMKAADTTRLENGLSPDGKESNGSFSYRFNDSLATYTISCNAFAKGYLSSYASADVTIVKSGLDGSLTGTGIRESDPGFKSEGIDYYYVSHNGLDWMRNNLATPETGIPYANSKVVSDILGKFYSYEDALKACPEGWRLPTDQEWRELAAEFNNESAVEGHTTIPKVAAAFMADAKLNLKEMWEYWPEVGEITNKSKMSMIPSGYANLGEKVDGGYPTADFNGIYEYAAFWTADRVEDEANMAYYRYLICDQPDMFIGKGDVNTFGASVRCVRENK